MTPIKESKNKVLTTQRDITEKWKSHFEKVLNRPEPENPASPDPAEDEAENINTDPPSTAEVRSAIKALKNNKAPGLDNITAEMLKADLKLSTKVLYSVQICLRKSCICHWPYIHKYIDW